MAIKKDEMSNPDSCLNRADDEEPLFVLRANDELASLAVMLWAGHYRISKEQLNDGEMLPHQEEKYNEAIDLAARMKRWKKDRTEKAE